MKFQLTILDSPSCIKNIGGLRSLHGIRCPLCHCISGAFSGWVGKKLGFHFKCVTCEAEYIALSQAVNIDPCQQTFAFEDFERQATSEMGKYLSARRDYQCLPPDFVEKSPLVAERKLEVLEGGKGREHQEEDQVCLGHQHLQKRAWARDVMDKGYFEPVDIKGIGLRVPEEEATRPDSECIFPRIEMTTQPQGGFTPRSTNTTNSERISLLTKIINSLQSILVKKDRR